MRRGSMLMEGWIVHLVIYAAIAIIIIPFVLMVMEMEAFDQTVYAADNALLADTLLAVPRGSVEYLYPFSDLGYTVSVTEDAEVDITNARIKRAPGVLRAFLPDAGTTVHPASFNPLLYQWVRGADSITIRPVSFSQSCPLLTELPEWDGRLARAVGEPYARHVIDDTLIQYGLRTSYDRAAFDAAAVTQLRILQGDALIITHSGEPVMDRLSCILAIELSQRDADIKAVLVNPSLGENILDVTVEESQESVLRESLTCAYKKWFSEGSFDGCV